MDSCGGLRVQLASARTAQRRFDGILFPRREEDGRMPHQSTERHIVASDGKWVD